MFLFIVRLQCSIPIHALLGSFVVQGNIMSGQGPAMMLLNSETKALFRLGACARALCPGAKKDLVQTPWCPRSNRVLLRQFSTRHFVCCIVRRHEEKTWGLKNPPVPVPRNGARVLPLELVPVPGHGAQIFAQALTKSSVQTIASTVAQEPGTGT